MTGVAYRRSAELAAALGSFTEFERNREPMLSAIEEHARALDRLASGRPADVLRAARREWTRALALGRRHGFRNAQTTLIPPTGTVSLMLDCETTGIEPYYALTTIKRFADGGEVRLSSRALVDGLAALGHSTRTIEQLSEYALDHGNLVGAPGLRTDEAALFHAATAANPLAPTAHLQMIAAVQPFLRGGVSKTVPLRADTGVEAIEGVFITPGAWDSSRSRSTAKAPSSCNRSPPTRTDPVNA